MDAVGIAVETNEYITWVAKQKGHNLTGSDLWHPTRCRSRLVVEKERRMQNNIGLAKGHQKWIYCRHGQESYIIKGVTTLLRQRDHVFWPHNCWLCLYLLGLLLLDTETLIFVVLFRVTDALLRCRVVVVAKAIVAYPAVVKETHYTVQCTWSGILKKDILWRHGHKS